MFGFGKDKGRGPVGAKEKLMKAQMLKRGGFEQIESKGEGKKPWGATVALIYFLAVGLAYVLQIGAWKNGGPNWHTGIGGIDKLLEGGVPSITGDTDEDTVIVPLLRGVLFFITGGFLPLLTLLWIRAIDKPHMNPFLAFWGVSVGVFFVFFFTRDFFGPLLGQVSDILSP